MSKLLTVPKPNSRSFAHIKPFVQFDNISSTVYPFILRRSPDSYAHVTSVFVVGKDHTKYESVKNLMKHWLGDVPKGRKTDIDLTGDIDMKAMMSKSWYVIDLRKKPDVWENEIKLINIAKASDHAVARICFELYEACKAIVIFADSVYDIPCTLMTAAAFGLTQERNNECTDFIYAGCAKTVTPTTALAFCATTAQKDILYGYNRFEEMPMFCSL